LHLVFQAHLLITLAVAVAVVLSILALVVLVV
jgi:hypothetical protein